MAQIKTIFRKDVLKRVIRQRRRVNIAEIFCDLSSRGAEVQIIVTKPDRRIPEDDSINIFS